nr:hypothetical protein [Halomonas alkaliantarctica]
MALQGAAYTDVSAYPLDVLGAETEGMSGYMIEQELGNLLPVEVPLATLLTQVEVDLDDPAFQHPSKPIGPVYTEDEAERLAKEKGTIVICAGGGGLPTAYDENNKLHGVEAVIDKDLCSALLAEQLQADLLIIATDVDAAYVDWKGPNQKAIASAHPDVLDDMQFAAGSMGLKIEAACRYSRNTGKEAVIGALADIEEILQGIAGTRVSTSLQDINLY